MESRGFRPLPLLKLNTNQQVRSSAPSGVLSPMTDLALNLGSLSTHSDAGARKKMPSNGNIPTPKCKLSLLLNDESPAASVVNSSFFLHRRTSAVTLESPTPVDSPSFQFKNFQFPNSSSERQPRVPFRRVNSMPIRSDVKKSSFEADGKENSRLWPLSTLQKSPLKRPLLSPKRQLDLCHPLSKALPTIPSSEQLIDSDSQDSGLGMEPKENSCSEDICSIFHNENANLEPPTKETSTSPRSAIFTIDGQTVEEEANSLRFSMLTSTDRDEDDGFLEIFNCESDEGSSVSSTMHSLLTAPVLKSMVPHSSSEGDLSIMENEECQENETPKGYATRPACRGLFRSPSAPEPQNRPLSLVRSTSFKRPDPPRDYHSPVSNKRRRSVCVDGPSGNLVNFIHKSKTHLQLASPSLQRCHSETEVAIKQALQRCAEEPDLIGDFTKTYALPLMAGKHRDLKSISPETLVSLMKNEYSSLVERFIIVDARFPYEYMGGHIKGALNLYTKDHMIDMFLSSSDKIVRPVDSSKRLVIVFHCEFSSERGPKLYRFLRNKDREANKEHYPDLYYPELYLLEGGYKAFYAKHKSNCDPQTYLPMNNKGYEEELRHFKAKSKSWSGERSRLSARPGLKF